MTFDPNHTYRTRCGQHVTNVHPIGQMLRGLRLCDGAHFIWFGDGRIIPNQDNFDDLLPGAIEDEGRNPASSPHSVASEGGIDPAVLQSQINRVLQDQIRAMGVTIAGMAAKIEELTKNVEERASIRPGTFNSLLDKLGMEIGDYDRVRFKTPTKPTINGGWVNVYAKDRRPGRVMGPTLFDTRAEADIHAAHDQGSRIACIQIPDFTEGEGL